MTDVHADAAFGAQGAQSWGRLPTPPSSGHTVVSVPTDVKPGRARIPLGGDAPDVKRMCRRGDAMLTPPSTRGRRMEDRLGIGASSASQHKRHCSDSFDSASLVEDMSLRSPSASRSRLRALSQAAPVFSRPVRDVLNNPFVEGGPADVGYTGPYASTTSRHTLERSPKMEGSTSYVLYVQLWCQLT